MPKNNGNLARMDQSARARTNNLAEWRKQRIHEETLPSGLQVMLRDVDMTTVMMEGNIPNTLVELISSDDFQKLNEEDAGKAMLENKNDFNTMMKSIVKAVLAEPVIGDVADDTHILYGELTFEDKMFIFNYMNREADALRSFREGESKPVTTA